jgi:hypothetical protein
MAKNIAVFGIYPSRLDAENAVDTLRQENFRNTDVSVLLPANDAIKSFGHEKNTKAPEGIGALAIPGVGPFVAAGPLLGALAGAGALGTAGGIMGSLVGMGIPEYEAKRYEGRIRNGGVLLSVHCDDSHWKERAEDVLERTGAEDISSAGETRVDTAEKQKAARARK